MQGSSSLGRAHGSPPKPLWHLQVLLTITAVPGAGNLLGNLLCAVANLGPER
jgi:hypothetical protein